MKKNTLFSFNLSIILILFFQSFISCHKDTSSNEPIEWVTDEEIPILAWHSVRLDAASLRGFEEVKNAGYTHSLSTIWDNEDPKTSFSANLLARALDYADK